MGLQWVQISFHAPVIMLMAWTSTSADKICYGPYNIGGSELGPLILGLLPCCPMCTQDLWAQARPQQSNAPPRRSDSGNCSVTGDCQLFCLLESANCHVYHTTALPQHTSYLLHPRLMMHSLHGSTAPPTESDVQIFLACDR